MKRKSILTLVCMLCLPVTTLFVNTSYAADAFVPNSIETSAQCEERVKNQTTTTTTTTTTSKAATGITIPEEECRNTCKNHSAPSGHKWYGTAPFCAGDKMNKNKKPYKDCTNAGGTPVDWSYCGDAKVCQSGTKILCKMPATSETVNGTTYYYKYLGKRPFCDADKKVSECKNLGGTEDSRHKCNDSGECCTSGKYLKCKIPQITGG